MELSTVGIESCFISSILTEVVIRKKVSRAQLLRFTANLRVKLIGIEACGGAHFLGGALREQGNEVRLMPAQYVQPYVKTNKNDYIDSEAIADAISRPRVRFVPIKTDDQLDMQSLHRVRERWALDTANFYSGSERKLGSGGWSWTGKPRWSYSIRFGWSMSSG